MSRFADRSTAFVRSPHEGSGNLVAVSAWHEQLRRTAPIDLTPCPSSAPIARFRDIDGRIGQPALDRTVLAIHLGGPKRVVRRQGTRALDVDVAADSLTLMPAGEAFEWETYGSVDFAHLTVGEPELRSVVAEEFDGDWTRLRLEPLVGVENRPVADILEGLVAATRSFGGERLYRDSLSLLLSLDIIEVFGRHPARGAVRRRAGTLATWQLRRVIDHMREHLAEDFDLATMVALTGLARAQFFRSFKRSIGRTPLAHLRHLRLLHARKLLVDTTISVTEIASAVGLEPTRLSAAFRQVHDMTPSAFRAAARS